MKKLYSATEVLAKILEVGHWVCTVAFALLFVLTLFPGDLYSSMLFSSQPGDMTVTTYGLEITVGNEGGFLKPAVRLLTIFGVPIMGLMAMVFRNISLILKTARGVTKFSKGATPFQGDVTRMIREIGIFFLVIAVLDVLFSGVAILVLGPDMADSSLQVTNIMIGLLMLCLSQAFAQGEKLQSDVDGLV